MTKQYTYVGRRFDDVLLSGYENGKKFNRRIAYQPTLYKRGKEGSAYHTFDGKPVEPVSFHKMQAAGNYIREMEASGEDVWGMKMFQYAYIHEAFADMESDASQFKILNIDIETDSEEGYGDSQKADREITSITLKLFGKPETYIIGTKPYETQDAELLQLIADGKIKVRYLQVEDERELLTAVIMIFKKLEPDVLTGWNIALFDVPVIVKRIDREFGENYAARNLSPFKLISESEVNIYNKKHSKMDIVGIAIVDYLDAFKKFSFKNFESYKLDYICAETIQARKLDYSEYGNLARLYRENPNMFYDYNIIDVYRVEQLDEKMKFASQIIMMAHLAKVNLQDTFGTVRIWEVLIHNYLMDRQLVCPISNSNRKLQQIQGAYVKNPVVGKHNAVMSFDWTSLYPSAIMAFNISPEMYRGKMKSLDPSKPFVDQILDGLLEEQTENLVRNDATVTGKGTVFANKTQGFIPAIMKMLFDQRKAFKNEMLKQEDLLQAIKAEKAKRGM